MRAGERSRKSTGEEERAEGDHHQTTGGVPEALRHAATHLASEAATGTLVKALVCPAKEHGQDALFDILKAKDAWRCHMDRDTM